MKILNISHGHPDRKIGGAEVATHHLHREYRSRDGITSYFLSGEHARSSEAHAHTPFALHDGANNELLFFQPMESFDYRLFKPGSSHALLTHFADFLDGLRPDIVHFHHFIGLGLPALRVVRNVVPDASIFLTLYEYLAICQNDGQLVKRGSLQLCHSQSPADCHRCFPDQPPREFLLRKSFIQSHLDVVDRFIASSFFIKERFVEWGIEAGRVDVVDNGFPRADPVPPRSRHADEGRGRFAYFGQLNPYKGVLTLLKAFQMLPPSAPDWITLDIYGANLSFSAPEFQRDFLALLEDNPRVNFHGPYKNSRLPDLMAEVDWTVIPSLWWENSPLVIQESNTCGRPVLASNIGGMAEKVAHDVNGVTFEVGSPHALKNAILRCATEDGLWDRLASNLEGGPWIDDVATRLLNTYRSSLLSR